MLILITPIIRGKHETSNYYPFALDIHTHPLLCLWYTLHHHQYSFRNHLMYICQGEYKTSHFAIFTGIMVSGIMLPGLVSGYLQKALGYPLFFVLVYLLTIPGMIALFFIT